MNIEIRGVAGRRQGEDQELPRSASRSPAKGHRPKARKEARSGRPPRALAGEVDERILDAAGRVFVERGFEGASIDQIADVARAGKPTIYARFPDKEALFLAVFKRRISDINAESYAHSGATLEMRLRSLGRAMLQRRLTPEFIALVRLGIAEARRFPAFAKAVGGMARTQAREPVMNLLSEAAASSQLRALPAYGSAHLTATAQYFLDLVVFPLVLRALGGEDLKSLGAEIEAHVARTVSFFLAGCRGLEVGD